jgi:serine/threonine-protein kinase
MEIPTELPAGIPRVGEIFAEKYRIESVLGIGGMGVVLAATHIHLEERVAIKLLLPAIAQNPEYVARFLREGRAAIKIRSEHVGRMIDVGKPAEGSPYLVMEHLVGQDLARVLEQRGPLPIAVAVDYLLQACEALAEAHVMGTIHRDLKPGNLFLTTRPDGTECVKVLDFGISKVADGVTPSADYSMTKSTTLMGSPLYMSPEQLRSLRSVDCRTDIWALGVILFEMLAGAPPFEGDTLPDLSVKIIVTEPPLLRSKRPEAPAALEAIVSHCLEKEVTKRVPDVAALAAMLAPFGSIAAAGSLERINKVFAPTSSPNLTSSQRISIRDPNSSSNPILIQAEGVARTEVAWDTLRDPVLTTKERLPYGLIFGAGAAAFAITAVLAFVFVVPRLRSHDPIVAPAVTTEPTARTVGSAEGAGSGAPTAAPPPTGASETNVAVDAGAIAVSTKPPATTSTRVTTSATSATIAKPPSRPPVTRPSAVPAVPAVPSPPSKPTAPTGVTLDRHG